MVNEGGTSSTFEWWHAAQGVPFISYAQHAEDVVLARGLRPDERIGTWIDVGANHPVSDSVTLAFSQRGWTGVNVEPLPGMHAELEAHRPRDVNIAAAVASEAGHATLLVGPGAHNGLATLDRSESRRWREEGIEAVSVEVEVTTLDAIVAEHVDGEVDFLKVDAEGSERAVLAGADWSTFRPRVVLVEATAPGDRRCNRHEWEGVLLDAGYQFVLFDGLNAFYVRPDEDELAEVLSVPANPHDNWMDFRLISAVEHETQLGAQNAELQAQLDQANAELDAIHRSRSWRYTSILRRHVGS